MPHDHATPGEWRQHWRLALAAIAGMMISSLASGSIGVFMAPLEREFGWSRTVISTGPALISFMAMALGTTVGLAIDRIGPRAIGISAVLAMCAGIGLMATVTAATWHWWALWAIVGCGAACMPTVWLTPINRAFSASRGLALAVALSGTGITNALVPMAANYFVENHGWRVGYIAIAAIWLAFVLPLVVLFFRAPAAPRKPSDPATPAALPGLTAREGFRNPSFYKLGFAAFFSTGAGVALILNLFPVLVATGLDRASAAWVTGLLGISTIVGRLFGGWLMDRFPAGIIAAGSAALAAALPAALLLAPGVTFVAAIGVGIYGLVGGAKIPAIAYLAGRHLGQRAFGTLYGTISAFIAASVALGPVAANVVYDLTRSYNLVMWVAVPLLALATLLYLSLGAYPQFAAERDTAA